MKNVKIVNFEKSMNCKFWKIVKIGSVNSLDLLESWRILFILLNLTDRFKEVVIIILNIKMLFISLVVVLW